MSNRTVYDLFSVEGKRALVTGGSAGMGRAIAEALGEGGARVAIVGRSGRVFDVAKEVGAVPLQADLADRAQALNLEGRPSLTTLLWAALVTLKTFSVQCCGCSHLAQLSSMAWWCRWMRGFRRSVG